MWRAWVERPKHAVDPAVVHGSVGALIAYSLLRAPEILSFIRSNLLGCGWPTNP
jgi:hypothetical protein